MLRAEGAVKMKINRDYYTEKILVQGTTDMYVSNKFADPQYLLNMKIDESACAFAQKGVRAPFNNFSTLWGETVGSGPDAQAILKIRNDKNENNISPMVMLTGHTLWSGNDMWQNLWGYNATAKGISENVTPIIAYDYNKICLVPILWWYNIGQKQYQSSFIDDYIPFAESANAILTGINYNIYYGEAGKRTKTNIRIYPSADIPYYTVDVTDRFVPVINTESKFLTYYYYNYTGGILGYWEKIDLYNMGLSNMRTWYGEFSECYELKPTTTAGRIISVYPRYQLSIDEIYEKCAFMGIPFALDPETAINAELGTKTTSDRVFYPIIDSDGCTNGKYVRGRNAAKTKQATEWKTPDSPFNDGGFNGVNKTDPNELTDKIDLAHPKLSTLNVFNRSFAINGNSVDKLADFLWNADETIFDNIVNGLKLMGDSPIQGIINLRLYPFNIATKTGSSAVQNIVIGRTDTGITGVKLNNDTNCIIDLGRCLFFQNYQNFLDYEPYTTAQLYIPYVGVIPVSTVDFMGHIISVKMIVDFVTGTCTAVVFRDDIPFIYRNGVIGVDIPITGNNASQYASGIISNVVGGAVSAVGSTIGGNPLALVSGISQGISNNNAKSTLYQNAGSSSPSVATWQPQKCYFIVSQPIPNTPTEYGHSVGYACAFSSRLGDVSGFTIVQNPELNINCTDDEKNMMIDLLNGGVFV